MSDYYEPHARLRLGKTVVLGGQIGCGAAAIGRNVAARIGLSFSEVDRLIEHEAGMSLAKLAFEDGFDRIGLRAESALARLVGRPPHGLVVLDRAWPPATAREILAREALFVRIDRPEDYLARRWAVKLERSGDWVLGGTSLRLPIEDARDLQPFFEGREPLLREAQIVLEAGDQHANRVADLLLESFEQISGAETP